MQTYLPKEQWMLVPREERAVLIEHFNLAKTGVTEVHDNTVVSDGYCTDDLRVINNESMAEYVGSSSDESFLRLWELTIAKAHSEVNPPIGTIKEGMVVDDGGEVSVQNVSTGAIIEPTSDAEPIEHIEHPNVTKNAPAKKGNAKK